VSLFKDEEFFSSQAMAQHSDSACDLKAADEALVDANTARNEEICCAATLSALLLDSESQALPSFEISSTRHNPIQPSGLFLQNSDCFWRDSKLLGLLENLSQSQSFTVLKKICG